MITATRCVLHTAPGAARIARCRDFAPLTVAIVVWSLGPAWRPAMQVISGLAAQAVGIGFP